MNNLGERIRKLRKERGMTLLDLAGNKITKGMLSLIENGRANPSMESLSHIAHQLGIDVHVLLEERSSEEIKRLLVDTEEKIEKNENENSYTNVKSGYKKIYQELAKVYKQKLPTTYESGRLYELGGRCLMNTADVQKGRELIEEAIIIYESLSLYNQALKAKTRFVYEEARGGKYKEALSYLYQLKNEYDKKISVIEPVIQIELDYLELILLFGFGEYDEGKRVLDRLLSFSKRKGVFHLMDDIYRIAAFQAMINQQDEDFKRFILKSQQFALFTDNNETYGYSLVVEAHYHNERTRDFDQALALLNKTGELDLKIGAEMGGYFYLEKGKSLYGKGMIDEALEQFALYKQPPQANHPFDLAMLYTVDSYQALCFLEKGEKALALSHAQKAFDQIKLLPATPYHDFVRDTLELVKQS